jgi:hypothetical protein
VVARPPRFDGLILPSGRDGFRASTVAAPGKVVRRAHSTHESFDMRNGTSGGRRTWVGIPASFATSLLIFASAVSVAAQPTTDLARRFSDEAPKAWAEYQAQADSFQGMVTIIIKQDDGRTLVHSKLEFRSNRSCRLQSERSIAPEPAEELNAFNSLYAFSLVRSSPDRPWAVGKIQDRRNGEEGSVLREVHRNLAPLHTLIRAYSEDLSDLVRQPTFRALSAAAVNEDGSDFVRVEFDNTHPVDLKGHGFFPIQGGTLTLDPNHFWCVRSTELRNTYASAKSLISIKNVYRVGADRIPIPEKSSAKQESRHETKGLRISLFEDTFELSRPDNPPGDESFTLSAFGLPEPFRVEPPRPWYSRWYLILAALAVLCLVAGALLARLAQRQRDQ